MFRQINDIGDLVYCRTLATVSTLDDMTLCATKEDFRLLRDLLVKRCGIFLGDEKHYLIENRLSPLAESLLCPDFESFCLKVKNSSPSGSLWDSVVDAMTTNETLWFRDKHPFVTLKESIFPRLREEISAGKRRHIRIWSAACSTGEEPYSIAMTAHDFYRSSGGENACRDQVRILATDLSGGVLAAAMAGRYSNMSIQRGLPPAYQSQYFEKKDGHWEIGPKVKDMVTFKKMNLLGSFTGQGPFDIVFLRNVLIYFAPDVKEQIFGRIARVLSPGGNLFLGTGETVRGDTSKFDVMEHKGAAYYQMKT